jgi:futalosine hydrolase
LSPNNTVDGNLTAYSYARHEVDVLTTGVGMVATAAWCSRALGRAFYDLALNLGVCGSFDPALPPGTVVHVVSDRLAELGAEDGDRFLTVEELGLGGSESEPQARGVMMNREPPTLAPLRALPAVAGITVNTASGHEAAIAAIVARFNPQVESMEGAGFMHACLIHRVPFAQIRGVSNMVERRNREAWKMPLAIRAVCNTALDLLDEA